MPLTRLGNPGRGREVTQRMPAPMHFPFPPPTPTLAAPPNPSKKSQQNNALCLFPARGQRILLYQPEQINKVCGTERFLRILRRGTLERACLLVETLDTGHSSVT